MSASMKKLHIASVGPIKAGKLVIKKSDIKLKD